MPAIYAYYILGKESIGNFPESVQKIITNNREAFNLGLQGLDPLYFLDFGTDKKAIEVAAAIRTNPFPDTLEKFTDTMKELNSKILFSYIVGFIGHYALDLLAKPYVYKLEAEGINHKQLETEFDRLLMEERGKNPFDVKTYKMLNISNAKATFIGELYRDFDMVPEDMKNAISDYRQVKKTLYYMQKYTPKLIDKVTEKLGIKEKTEGIYLKKERNRYLVPMVHHLESRYDLALTTYPKLVRLYLMYLLGTPLSKAFDRDFVNIKKK